MSDHPTHPARPAGLRIGRRVVVRHRGEQGDIVDVLGELLDRSASALVVRTRRGVVTVDTAQVLAAKEVPPRATRRAAPHKAVATDDLELVAVDGMPPLLTERLGDWRLRAANGFTNRANSALVVGSPGCTLDEAVAHVERWYAERDLPARLQLLGPDVADIVCSPIGRLATGAGWVLDQPTLVMSAAVAEAALTAPPQASVIHRPAADEQWWSVAAARSRDARETADRILERVDRSDFLTLLDVDGQPIGHGRAAYSPGWVGLFDIRVVEDARGRGLGRAIVGELAREAARHGVRSAYLQVAEANSAALAVYSATGFTRHHLYCYATEPTDEP